MSRTWAESVIVPEVSVTSEVMLKHRWVNYDNEIDKIFKYHDDNNLMHCVDNKVDCCCRVYYSSVDLRIPF